MSLLRFHFQNKKLLMVSLLFRFIFVKNLFNYSLWQWNQVLCNALFRCLCLSSYVSLSIHLSISFSFLLSLPVPLLFRILMYALLSKFAYELAVYFCYVRMKPKKNESKKTLETNVQTDKTPTQMACLLTETAL